MGDTFNISARVHLGAIAPEKVDVELYYGRLESLDKLVRGRTLIMDIKETLSDGAFTYACTVTCEDSGRYGFTVRVVPRADDWIRYTPGLLTWA